MHLFPFVLIFMLSFSAGHWRAPTASDRGVIDGHDNPGTGGGPGTNAEIDGVRK